MYIPSYSDLLSVLLDIGETLLISGAEVSRVEDTIARLGYAYGAERVDIFVITSDIILTVRFAEGAERTQMRRIAETYNTDFRKLEELNALSRACCAEPLPVDELERRVREVCAAEKPVAMQYLGSILAGGAFTMFFGGGWADGLFAAAVSALVCFLQCTALPYFRNAVVFDFLTGLAVGSIVCAAGRLMPLLSVDTILIGTIMLLIPGVATTNATRDMLVGHTISGLMRLSESLLLAGALAMGFGSAIYLIGV